jgi:hypothetical protein
MRIAKMEMKVVLAMFLVGFEYELVDSSGNFPKELPLQDRNDIQQVRSAPMIFLRDLRGISTSRGHSVTLVI